MFKSCPMHTKRNNLIGHLARYLCMLSIFNVFILVSSYDLMIITSLFLLMKSPPCFLQLAIHEYLTFSPLHAQITLPHLVGTLITLLWLYK